METGSILLTLVGMLLGSTALSALITGLLANRREKKKKHGGVEAGVRALLYDKIKYLGTKYISDGKVATDELEDIIAMHNTYKQELGGNGFLDAIMDDVKKLPKYRRKNNEQD